MALDGFVIAVATSTTSSACAARAANGSLVTDACVGPKVGAGGITGTEGVAEGVTGTEVFPDGVTGTEGVIGAASFGWGGLTSRR